jgi:N-ethylmaleimide reductase
MAPMTRNRADENGDPNQLMAEYYTQRASFGLIVTEGTAPEHVGKAYPHIPGIYTAGHVTGWKKITDSVHAAGGNMYMQLMHSGRISHSHITGLDPIAPSAVRPKGELFTGKGMESFETPIEMSATQLEATKLAFVNAAKSAIEAGFDGVELHAANGYLLHQFLAENSNIRTDRYGGSAENRARFILEVTDEVIKAIGGQKVGIRISPNGKFNDIEESNIEENYGYLISELNTRELAYLHLADQFGFDGISFAREHFTGVLMANSGYADKAKVETATRTIAESRADLFSFGRLALANPDLPSRLASRGPLNEADSKSFYSGGSTGYIDYPALA